MNWLSLILISVCIQSFCNIFQRVLMRDDTSDPVSYTAIFCLLEGILNFSFALFYGFHLPTFNFNLVYIFISAAFWSISLVTLFKSFQFLESSEVTILTSTRALITIIVSILFLHQVFNIQKTIGSIIILGSILFVARLKKGFRFNKGILFALTSALCGGLAVIFDSINVKSLDPLSYLAIVSFIIGFLLVGFYPKTLQQLNKFTNTSFLKKMLILVVFSFGQAVAYYFALKKGPVAQIAPINQTQVILTILIAAVVLDERDHLVTKIVTGIFSTIGVILLG